MARQRPARRGRRKPQRPDRLFGEPFAPSRPRRSIRGLEVVTAIVLAVLTGLGIAVLMPAPRSVVAVASGAGEPLLACRALDGDTLRCGSERVRLLGIDAPELPGHCREGRNCAPGDPQASKAALSQAANGTLTIQRVGTDRYGRTIALVASAAGDLSCRQLESGHAIYRADWDDGGRLAAGCSVAR